jgi:hypothetical protein
MGDEREFKIRIVTDASSAVAGGAQTAKSLEGVAEATKKAADETQRYQQALQKMAETQAAGQTKTVSAEDQSMLDKAAQRKKAIEERRALTTQADKDIADGVKVVSRAESDLAIAEAEAAKKTVEGDSEVFASKKQLKEAVKGLREEFPLLAHVAHLAMNPITFVVAGIGAAFAIWKARVDGLVQSLAGVQLPDLSEAQVERVHAMATAYSDFAEAMRKAVEAYESVDAAAARDDKRIDAEMERNKKLLESQKNLALSKLEADKASLKPGEYERAKSDIEDFYESIGIKEDQATKQKKLERKAQREDELAADAQAKLDQAARIKVGSEADDAKLQGDYDAQYKAAMDDIKERQAWQTRMAEYMDKGGSTWGRMKTGWAFKRRYGQGETPQGEGMRPFMEIENQQIASDMQIVERYRDWQREQPNRKLARNRRGELVDAAGKEAGEAEVIHREMWEPGGELDQFDLGNRNQGQVAGNNQLARAYKASGEVNDKALQVSEEIQRSIEGGNKVLAAVIKKLADFKAAQDVHAAKIESLEQSRKLNPPST